MDYYDMNNKHNLLDKITLKRGQNGMGFNIRGGKDNPIMKGENGIFVMSIRPNGSVFKQNKLQLFDQIIEVNGINIENVCHHFALSIFHKNQVCDVVVNHNSFNRLLIKSRELMATGDIADLPLHEMYPDKDEGIEEDMEEDMNLNNLPMIAYTCAFVSVLFIIGIKITNTVLTN